jgi:hypothetical protein
MVTVKAMIITVDSLLSRSKLDCDVGYDATVKGAGVVVIVGFGDNDHKIRELTRIIKMISR